MPTYRVFVRRDIEVSASSPLAAVNKALERLARPRREDVYSVRELVPQPALEGADIPTTEWEPVDAGVSPE